MAPQFDIFLACAPKDYHKLPYVVKAAVENVIGFTDIVICSPTDLPFDIASKIPCAYKAYLDVNAMPGGDTREKWKHRPNWCFQQHLKLFQQFTRDWYVTLDCDTIINRPMEFFEGNTPIGWKGSDQNYHPYFLFQEMMIGIGRLAPRSFIADMNLFSRKIIEEILERNDYTIQSFIAKSQEITDPNCHIGEPELYGNYCYKYHQGLYIERILKNAAPLGSRFQKTEELVWNDAEIEQGIAIGKSFDADTLSFHSWYDEGDQ